MDRRELFKGIIGTATAAPVVKAAAAGQPFPYCERCQAHHTASVSCYKPPYYLPDFTDKQREVWAALRNPDIRMVLFSGGRGCGRSFLAREYAKSLQPYANNHKLALFPRYKGDSAEDIRGCRFDHVIIDDAHRLSWDQLNRVLGSWRWYAPAPAKILFTAAPGGPGQKYLHTMFPKVGHIFGEPGTMENRYHVNAGLRDNPHTAREPRLFQART
jgi:hypothetical protein